MNQSVRIAPPQDFIQEAVRQAPEPSRHEAELDARKRSFLRMASHELRTPLNSILGFSEILATELFGPLGSPQYKEYATIIRESGERLLRLVNQILEIARLEGQAADLDLRPEPLDAAVDDAIDGLAREIKARGVRPALKSDGWLPHVVADPRGLRTVLSALIQNAVNASPEGGEVRIRADPAGDWVDIVIEDDGPGVDPEELPRLVRAFEQGENALTRHSEGAGLGLPICELLCRAMGGRLILHSALGRGFSAKVRLARA